MCEISPKDTKLSPAFHTNTQNPNPFMNPMGPVPGGARSAGVMPTSLDDYVRRPLVELTSAEKAELFFTLDSI